MSTPTQETDGCPHGIIRGIGCWKCERAELQSQLTTALARVAELEKEVSRWHKSFDGHVYVKSSEYAERALERESLTRQLSETQAFLAKECAKHDAANTQLDKMEVENEALSAQLASAREDSAMLDWLERQAKDSYTGISFDWCRHAKEGQIVEHGFRFMRLHFLGERATTLRQAIRLAQKSLPPPPQGKEKE